MNAHGSTDLTEEDAADLQFPKESAMDSDRCGKCTKQVDSEKFVLCVVCDVPVCCECFASGAEFDGHRSNHDYKILHSDFVLLRGSDWTAHDEVILLEGLTGRKSWDVIGEGMNRSGREVAEHYNRFYLGKNWNLPVRSESVEILVPYRFKLSNVQDPIRHHEATPAGYNAARSDFEFDHDKSAEEHVASLETLDPEEHFFGPLSELQVAITNAYRRKLCERLRRKQIIREHGLIMQRKTPSWLHRYDTTVSPHVFEKLVRFMQFYTGEGFVKLMEGLHRAGELKVQISRLCEFRKKGIHTLDEAKLYLKLKSHRDESVKDIKRFQQISEINIKMRSLPSHVGLLSNSKRRSMAPLEIIGLPAYEKLLPVERELCRSIRLAPLSYIELKGILIAENNKLGYLRLYTARKVLKIDVNKTRKLYDFLMDNGYITKPKD